MRGVFCTKQRLDGPIIYIIYINEQDFIDRPELKTLVGSHSRTTKPCERWRVEQPNGEEPSIFLGWEFWKLDFDNAVMGLTKMMRFREDSSLPERFEEVK